MQVRMPRSLIVLCLTNLFCWASLVCYSLYFTDFVGQSVYHGDPTAKSGTLSHGRYEAGVRAGALGMALYSASCSVYSLNIEKLVRTFGEVHQIVGAISGCAPYDIISLFNLEQCLDSAVHGIAV